MVVVVYLLMLIISTWKFLKHLRCKCYNITYYI